MNDRPLIGQVSKDNQMLPPPAPESTLSDARPESGAQTADAAQGPLVERLAEAMRRSPNGVWMTLPGPTDIAPSFARALLPLVEAHAAAEVEAAVSVVRAERDEARAENERLRVTAAENRSDIEGWKTSTRELEQTWQVEHDRVEFQRDRAEVHRARAESAESEVRALREKVAKVEALRDEWREWASVRSTTRIDAFRDAADSLNAALSDPTTPDQSEPQAWIDVHGDVWREGEDGLMHSFETAPFPREHVEKKWGLLRPAAQIEGPQ